MKIRYEIDLADLSVTDLTSPSIEIRHMERAHEERLAHLMLEAYRGTIDWEDESIEDARDEVGSFFAGPALLEHSFVTFRNGELVSAVFVLLFEDGPFIGYVITDPDAKGQGHATAVTRAALATLREAGHPKVNLYITEGNLASEALFGRLGARAIPAE